MVAAFSEEKAYFLNVFETNLKQEIEKFEEEVSQKFQNVPSLGSTPFDIQCPYFTDMKTFFRSGLLYVFLASMHKYNDVDVECENVVLSRMNAIFGSNPDEAVYTQKLYELCKDYGNFYRAFMPEIRKMNQEIASDIIAQICQKILVMDYDKYKETIDTDELKEYFIKREQERKEERTRIQSEYISIVKTRLAEVDSRISELGKTLWGEKARDRKELDRERNRLQNELDATERWVPLDKKNWKTSFKILPTEEVPQDSILDLEEWVKDGYYIFTKNVEIYDAMNGEFALTYGRGRRWGAVVMSSEITGEQNSKDERVVTLVLAVYEKED